MLLIRQLLSLNHSSLSFSCFFKKEISLYTRLREIYIMLKTSKEMKNIIKNLHSVFNET